MSLYQQWRRARARVRAEAVVHRCIHCGALDPSIEPDVLNHLSEYCCNCLARMVGH